MGRIVVGMLNEIFFKKRLGLYIDQDQMHGTLDSIHSKRGYVGALEGAPFTPNLSFYEVKVPC